MSWVQRGLIQFQSWGIPTEVGYAGTYGGQVCGRYRHSWAVHVDHVNNCLL